MGRFYAKPDLITTNLEDKLRFKWYKVFVGNEHCGDVLASFELIEKNANTLEINMRREHLIDKYQSENREMDIRNLPIAKLNELIFPRPKNIQYTLEVNAS